MKNIILGISAYYHDSAAALVIDGEVVAAAQEERFTRKKNDASFPIHAIDYMLRASGVEMQEITDVVFYDKPLLKFERLLETYHVHAPRGLRSFLKAIPLWLNNKLFMERAIRHELGTLGKVKAKVLFTEHHLAHAASAFFPSPFREAAILTVDGVGEWATTTLGYGVENSITVERELHFPHSIGLLYSSFTHYLGFKVNSGEYKLMGLAPYGDRNDEQTIQYVDRIFNELIVVKGDGSFRLNMDYFDFATDLQMTNDRAWQKLFGVGRRTSESMIKWEHCNLAAAIQVATEEVLLRLVRTTREMIASENLVMAGGVALNCVANAKIAQSRLFGNLWIQPASGDAGGALGAALAGWYISQDMPRKGSEQDGMAYGYLGPSFTSDYIERILKKYGLVYKRYEDEEMLFSETAVRLDAGDVVGWFQDRMEFGPRALGNRSILADPRRKDMQMHLNLKIKKREGFRPFAPSVLVEDAAKYFSLDHESPYMLFTAQVKDEHCKQELEETHNDLLSRLNVPRSTIPAVTHVDFSARVQTVSSQSNKKFWKLLQAFKAQTGLGMLINTSFNVRGEPIVCTPQQAVEGFLKTEMDVLVVGQFLVMRSDQAIDINRLS